MNRIVTMALVTALVVSAVGVVPVAGFSSQPTAPVGTAVAAQADNATEANVAEIPPGAQFAGVVGVHRVEVDAAVERRSFGLQVAAASSNGTRSAVVADRLQQLEERLRRLEAQRDELRQARESGQIGEGRYRAEISSLVARSAAIEDQANLTLAVASDIPEETLAERGIDPVAIVDLRERARGMPGSEAASIARSIAGPGAGRGLGGGPSAGPPVPALEGDRGPRDGQADVNRTGPRDSGPPDDTGPPADRDKRGGQPTAAPIDAVVTLAETAIG